jgi:hypothetical protein
MFNLQPAEILMLLVMAGVVALGAFGLYWIIRKAIADGQRDGSNTLN